MLSGIQGAAVAFAYCFYNDEVREELREFINEKKEKRELGKYKIT